MKTTMHPVFHDFKMKAIHPVFNDLKMKAIHAVFHDLKMYSVMITCMTHTKNLWKVVIMMTYKHEKFSLQLSFVYLHENCMRLVKTIKERMITGKYKSNLKKSRLHSETSILQIGCKIITISIRLSLEIPPEL